MAAGEFAEPIYKLLDDLGVGAEEAVLDDLIRWLDGDTIKDFVEDFRRHHNMVDEGENLDSVGFEDYHLCMDCQESYDINKSHVCSDNGETKDTTFFSSLIPEC